MRIEWHREEEFSSPAPVRQVYGLFFDEFGYVFLQKENGHYNLPGGKPENNESFIETLERETLEESQLKFERPMYIGHLSIINDPDSDTQHYVQLRFVAIINQYLERDFDPATNRMYERVLCPPRMANTLLGWGEHGNRQIAAACKVMRAHYGLRAAQGTEIRFIDQI
jgi:ADP-ribose pyrophosphatase YjhB (NUDIX family)